MKRTSLLILAAVLFVILAVLLAVALLLPSAPPETTDPAPTAAPTAAPTSPPPTTPPTTLPATQAPTTLPTQPQLEENPYLPKDFGYEGDYLTCFAGESLLGVDVSAYQPEVDWEAVKAAGVDFVMLRAGFRGWGSAGNLKQDPVVEAHYAGAKAAGLQVGVYFFSQAVSPEEAREEADFLLDIIDTWELSMPVAYDWEYISAEARTADTDGATVTACAEAFCQAVAAAGYDPMVYVSTQQTLLDLEALAQYPMWVALYGEEMTWPHRFAMWQYTSTGTVPGISGNADINLWLPPQ